MVTSCSFIRSSGLTCGRVKDSPWPNQVLQLQTHMQSFHLSQHSSPGFLILPLLPHLPDHQPWYRPDLSSPQETLAERREKRGTFSRAEACLPSSSFTRDASSADICDETIQRIQATCTLILRGPRRLLPQLVRAHPSACSSDINSSQGSSAMNMFAPCPSCRCLRRLLPLSSSALCS